jgi:diguanylate cyclase (GGDEF)-like protein
VPPVRTAIMVRRRAGARFRGHGTKRLSANEEAVEKRGLDQAHRRWLDALTDGSREALALLGDGGEVRYLRIGVALGQALGFEGDELAPSALVAAVHPDDLPRLYGQYQRIAGEPGSRQTTEYRLRHRLGHYLLLQSTAINRLEDDDIQAIVVHTRLAPIGDAVFSEDGPASQVRDRYGFIERLQDVVSRSRLEQSYGFSVLIIELERLKMLVGSYGQGVVDELLVEVAQRLLGLLRPEDLLARFGGGEFAVLLDGVGDRRRAAKIADRIQTTIAMRFQIGSHAISTSGIVGIATSERAYEQAEHVIRDASLAANRARARGKNRRAVFQTQMRVEDTRFMTMVSELHNAIQAEQLCLHYQPVVALGDGRIAGFEALLRWQHPTLGFISPVQFIPIAEETGLIVQLGHWVLREACRQMAAFNEGASEPLYVSVNLSAKQFGDDDLPGQIEAALGESGLDARQLVLEITESAVLENRDQATGALERLKARGVRVSLDDFGTGYSSFSYLHQLPYDTLKIDRSFVSRLGEERDSSEIVHAIIVLAHNLRMNVVAEGVETEAQAKQLKSMWCEYAQGFHFARPLEPPAVIDLLARGHGW